MLIKLHNQSYHSFRDGRYPIPNDDIEQNREETKHAMVMELTDGKLFHAPIGDSPSKIIDLGTGTRKFYLRPWADWKVASVDIAQKF